MCSIILHKGSFLYANFHNYHKIQTNIPNKYTKMILTNTITCSILIIKETKNKIKRPIYHTSGVGAPLTDRSFHKTRKNALMLLLHIHDPISSNIRAFSAMFPVVIISTKNNFVGKL